MTQSAKGHDAHVLNQAGLETHGLREVLAAPVISQGFPVHPSLPLPSPLLGLKLSIPYFSLTSLSVPLIAAVIQAKGTVKWRIPGCVDLADKIVKQGTSLPAQWLGLHTFSVGSASWIPGQRTKIPHATWQGQKRKKKRIVKQKRFTQAD